MKQYLLALLFVMTLSACSSAKSEDIHVELMSAPDASGTTCYVLMQNGEAKGLSCK